MSRRDRTGPATLGAALSALFGEGALAMAGWTDAEWAAHDERVRAGLAAEQRERELEQRRVRARQLGDVAEEVAAVALAHAAGELRWDAARHALLDRLVHPRAATELGWRGRPRPGLAVLSGAVGRGKSSLAIAWLVESGGSSPAYAHANRLASVDRGSFAGASVERSWRGFSAMVIDDLGAENLDTQAARGFLGLLEEILDTAAMSGRAVLITTNVKRDHVGQRYGRRLESRLGAGLWLELAGADLRSAGAATIADTGRKR